MRKEVCRYLGRHGTNRNQNQWLGFCSGGGENKAEAGVKEVRRLRVEVEGAALTDADRALGTGGEGHLPAVFPAWPGDGGTD